MNSIIQYKKGKIYDLEATMERAIYQPVGQYSPDGTSRGNALQLVCGCASMNNNIAYQTPETAINVASVIQQATTPEFTYPYQYSFEPAINGE